MELWGLGSKSDPQGRSYPKGNTKDDQYWNSGSTELPESRAIDHCLQCDETDATMHNDIIAFHDDHDDQDATGCFDINRIGFSKSIGDSNPPFEVPLVCDFSPGCNWSYAKSERLLI